MPVSGIHLFVFIRVYSRFDLGLAVFFLIQPKTKLSNEPLIPQGTLSVASDIHLVDANTRE